MCGPVAVQRCEEWPAARLDRLPSAAGLATDSQLPGLPLQGFSRSTAASPSKQPSQND